MHKNSRKTFENNYNMIYVTGPYRFRVLRFAQPTSLTISPSRSSIDWN